MPLTASEVKAVRPSDKPIKLSDGEGLYLLVQPNSAKYWRLAADKHYETQERLITRIVKACAAYAEIISLEIILRKQPVLNDSGSLGVRLCMDRAALNHV